jgi:hypothetical protein
VKDDEDDKDKLREDEEDVWDDSGSLTGKKV